MRCPLCWVVAFVLTAVGPLPAQSPKRPDAGSLLPLLTGGSTDSLAGALRGVLLQSMPTPLYEASPNWGNTRHVARGLKWDGTVPELKYVRRNDGKWRRIRVEAEHPADTLVFDLREVSYPEAGRMAFTVFLSMDARLLYERQNWEGGLKLYDGSAAARFRIRATLHCEASARVEAGALLLPEAVFRLRVLKADVGYDNFVMEHTAGLGGEAAKVLGDAVKGGIHKWHPDLETNLLAKANAAIEKAADTKEVRVNLFELLKKATYPPRTAPAKQAGPVLPPPN